VLDRVGGEVMVRCGDGNIAMVDTAPVREAFTGKSHALQVSGIPQ
jgi:hypothetical protein